jgi:hypothetical protein
MRRAVVAGRRYPAKMDLGAVFAIMALFGFSASAQVVGPINPRVPPQPPRAEQSSAPEPAPQQGSASAGQLEIEKPAAIRMIDWTKLNFDWPVSEPPPPDLPERVAIPAGRPIAVVLDTPLSTRIAKKGGIVVFRTSAPMRVADGLEVPPDVRILGRVVEVKRPGHFGKAGMLRVKVDSLQLDTGGGVNLQAHLDSADMKGSGQLTTDSRGSTDFTTVAMDSIQGTLLGTVMGGAKGAAIGAGAGAAIAVLVMMSHRGQDVYLEPGMPFTVILDEPAFLRGADVLSAQISYQQHRNSEDSSASADSGRDEPSGGPPRLKRRGANPHR